MDTRITLVITAFVAAVVVGATAMVAKPVVLPITCTRCGALFAPGLLGDPSVLAPGNLAKLNSLPASQFAPGQEAKNLNSPG